MSTPKVSIIIPCYNMERFVDECLESVVTQTLSEIEIICINDGSTDNTLAVLKRYQQRDPRVVIIDQQNQGVGAARNNGMRKATGEYVAFMDPDDFYPDAGTLEKLYTKASENHALICGGSFSSYYNKRKIVSASYTGNNVKYTLTQEGFVDYRDYQFDFGYHRFLYSRAFLIDNQIFFPLYARFQDPPFFVTAMITAGKFYAIPDVVYRYRCGFQVKSTKWPSSKLHDMMKGYLDNLNISAQNHLSELHALTVRRFEADNVHIAVLNSLRSGDKETLALMIEINQAIRPDLLKEAGMNLNVRDGYILREFEELLVTFSGVRTNADLWEYDIQESLSFRIGCAITYVPKKIRSAIRCCRENGIWYTVRLFFARVFGRER